MCSKGGNYESKGKKQDAHEFKRRQNATWLPSRVISGLTNEETGNDQRSIDLIGGAAAECYVTSKKLRYRRCGGFEVTVRHASPASGHNRLEA
jgi:hypothetical protein